MLAAEDHTVEIIESLARAEAPSCATVLRARAPAARLREQGEVENRARLTVVQSAAGWEVSHRSIVRQHPFASACDGIGNRG